jgi:hypothetical protein
LPVASGVCVRTVGPQTASGVRRFFSDHPVSRATLSVVAAPDLSRFLAI